MKRCEEPLSKAQLGTHISLNQRWISFTYGKIAQTSTFRLKWTKY